ncbi:hypothetical protein HPP92_023082 [Vanilla planifolia]|uniref:non-specific serine/threonine protein kinase n=1 Tax=Vanilla planifolia TaxID=51239 RepID=A0A835UEF1_VANPL|nr:hypothetical protein HPP92_023082 [Vanilla planifolia]
MSESASSPTSAQEALPSAIPSPSVISPSTSGSSPSPPAPVLPALNPPQNSQPSPPSTGPSTNDSSSGSATQPNNGGNQSSAAPKASPVPLPPNNVSSPPPPQDLSPPPNKSPPTPVPPVPQSIPVPSPPPSPQSHSTPPASNGYPPADPVLSPPPAPKKPILSPPAEQATPPAQQVTPPASATPNTNPPNSSVPITVSPPIPKDLASPPSQGIPSGYTPSALPDVPRNGQGNPPSANGPSSGPVSSSHLVSSSGGVVVAATVIGAVVAFTAVVLLILAKRKRRVNGSEKHYGPISQSSLKGSDGLHQRNVNEGNNSPAVPRIVSRSPFSPAVVTSHGSHGGYGCPAGTPEAAGSGPLFSYEELMGITNGFSLENKIGEGGFGAVYRGSLPDGKLVAIKQLKVGSGQGEREFRAEVDIISRIHHRHLVSLVGYCISEHHRLLVYEFVPNKTLEHHLHGNEWSPLDWEKRAKIALGSARGLVYLHEYCHPRIIHRDIKSANILLDDSFEAMVADFGLAKLANDASTHVSTRVVGTFGYMAPEYAASGKLTDKSDVFSFGVVLLELITGRKPVDTSRPLGEESLVEWARPLLVQALETGNCAEIVDPRLENCFPEADMLKMIELAASCVRHSAVKRPRMAQVLRALEDKRGTSDLSNGVKVGESVVYDSAKYSADIHRFQRLAFASHDLSSELGTWAEHEQVSPASSRRSLGDAPVPSSLV